LDVDYYGYVDPGYEIEIEDGFPWSPEDFGVIKDDTTNPPTLKINDALV